MEEASHFLFLRNQALKFSPKVEIAN